LPQRYKAGLVSYLTVVFAQETLLANERIAAQLRGRQAGSLGGADKSSGRRIG
jgi:outer membrane protein TolC